MQVQSMHFRSRAAMKLADARLQKNLAAFADKIVGARAAAISELDDFEGPRFKRIDHIKSLLNDGRLLTDLRWRERP